jgi:hypothetical protein
MHNGDLAFGLLAAILLMTGPAGAQTSVDAPQQPTLQSQPWLHDGFYLRLSTGLGTYGERIDRPGQESYASVVGVAHTADIAAGTAIKPGVALGAGFWITSVLASNTRTFDGVVTTSSTSQNPSSWVVGPWLDYYFNPRGGLHLPAAVGVAMMNGFDYRGFQLTRDKSALGAGLLVGLGYDWWISEQWSVGVLGRVTAIAATNKDDEGRSWIHLTGSAPSLLFSAAYN